MIKDKVTSAPVVNPLDSMDAHTAAAKELIRAGKLRADDPRSIIAFEEFEQSEIECTQGCSVAL